MRVFVTLPVTELLVAADWRVPWWHRPALALLDVPPGSINRRADGIALGAWQYKERLAPKPASFRQTDHFHRLASRNRYGQRRGSGRRPHWRHNQTTRDIKRVFPAQHTRQIMQRHRDQNRANSDKRRNGIVVLITRPVIKNKSAFVVGPLPPSKPDPGPGQRTIPGYSAPAGHPRLPNGPTPPGPTEDKRSLVIPARPPKPP